MSIFNFFKKNSEPSFDPVVMVLPTPFSEYSLEELIEKSINLSKEYDRTQEIYNKELDVWSALRRRKHNPEEVEDEAKRFGHKHKLSQLEILEKKQDLLDKNEEALGIATNITSDLGEKIGILKHEWFAIRKEIRRRQAINKGKVR